MWECWLGSFKLEKYKLSFSFSSPTVDPSTQSDNTGTAQTHSESSRDHMQTTQVRFDDL